MRDAARVTRRVGPFSFKRLLAVPEADAEEPARRAHRDRAGRRSVVHPVEQAHTRSWVAFMASAYASPMTATDWRGRTKARHENFFCLYEMSSDIRERT